MLVLSSFRLGLLFPQRSLHASIHPLSAECRDTSFVWNLIALLCCRAVFGIRAWQGNPLPFRILSRPLDKASIGSFPVSRQLLPENTPPREPMAELSAASNETLAGSGEEPNLGNTVDMSSRFGTQSLLSGTM